MAKMDNQPKRHHYIPCMLLSKFGIGNGRAAKVWVWDKTNGKVWNARVDTVGYRNDLYRIPAELLKEPAPDSPIPPEFNGEYVIEQLFGAVEADFAASLRLIENKLQLPPVASDEYFRLLETVALFDLRTPARMEEARQIAESLANLMAEVNFPDFTDAQRVSLPFRTNQPLLMASVLQHFPHLMDFLIQRHWSLRVTSDADYVLTDFPVMHEFARARHDGWEVPAPAVKHTITMMPLTRHVLLTGEYEVPGGVRVADAYWVGYFNRVALARAERFVFTHDSYFAVLTNADGLAAYDAVTPGVGVVTKMTPERFALEVQSGKISPPQRMTINGVAPKDYRLNEHMKLPKGFNPTPQNQVLLKNTFLDEDGQEVPISEVLRQRDEGR